MATTDRTTSGSLRRRTLLAAAVSTIGLGGVAKAEISSDLVGLQVVDRETGHAMRTWRHHDRLFVAGRPGARYSLRVTNHSGGRVLVVMSVDGVNILTGQTAGYNQRGYVFDPYQSYDISGWRKSDTEVAAFNFAALRDSYAARTGRPHDVGVIGIAAFRERVRPPPVAVAPMVESAPASRDNEVSEMVVTQGRIAAAPPPAVRARPGAAAPEAAAGALRRSERLGTGHGAREWSAVTTVAFERATPYPQLIRRIEYDSYPNLVAAGVIPSRPPPAYRPRPFPSSGYVPDPPGGR